MRTIENTLYGCRLTNESNHNIVTWLAQKPSHIVTKSKAYDINGNMFYMKGRDERTTYQNSSVRIESLSASKNPKKEVYYGTIQEIWELDYVKIKVALFKCKWVALSEVNVDEYGKTYVNLNNMEYHSDPFILASQATQVFYVPDTLNENCHVVMFGKRRILGVENVVDEEEYNLFDDLPTVGA